MKIASVILMFVVAQWRGCATACCEMFDPSPTPEIINLGRAMASVVDVQPLGEGELLFVIGDEAAPGTQTREIILWSEASGARPIVALRFGTIIGEGLSTGEGGRWWYSVAGSHAGDWGVLFVEGNGNTAGASRFLPMPVGAARWLPVAASEPKGLYLESGDGSTSVSLISPTEVLRDWTILGRPVLRVGWWSAQPLADGTIALASLESASAAYAPSRVVLRVLRASDSSDVVPHVILREGRTYSQVGMTAGPGRWLAIAVRTEAGLIATILDPHQPAELKWTTLTEPGEVATLVALTLGERDLTAAWVATTTLPGTVRFRARTVRSESRGSTPITLGSAHQRVHAVPFFAVRTIADELLVVWQTDEIEKRRLPRAIDGYQLATDVWKRLCADRAQRKRPPASARWPLVSDWSGNGTRSITCHVFFSKLLKTQYSTRRRLQKHGS